MFKMEEYALSMGQRSHNAAKEDAQIKLRREDYARSTGQMSIGESM